MANHLLEAGAALGNLGPRGLGRKLRQQRVGQGVRPHSHPRGHQRSHFLGIQHQEAAAQSAVQDLVTPIVTQAKLCLHFVHPRLALRGIESRQMS